MSVSRENNGWPAWSIILPVAVAECRRRPAGDRRASSRSPICGHHQGRHRPACNGCGAPQWRNAAIRCARPRPTGRRVGDHGERPCTRRRHRRVPGRMSIIRVTTTGEFERAQAPGAGLMWQMIETGLQSAVRDHPGAVSLSRLAVPSRRAETTPVKRRHALLAHPKH